MTQPALERNVAQTSRPEQAPETILAQLTRWQRVATGCAAVGAATILVCALTTLRPLPSVGPPPSGIAPLLPSEASAPYGTPVGILSNAAANNIAPSSAVGTPAPASASAPTLMNAQAYIAFVKQIDQQRGSLVASFDSALSGSGQSQAPQEFNAPNPAASALTQTAQSLQSAFQAQPAPLECGGLSTAYAKLLQDQCGLIVQASPSIGSGDPRGASALAAAALRQLTSDASAADQSLGAAASAAQIAKPFVIAADPSQIPGASPITPAYSAQGGQPGTAVNNVNGAVATVQPAQTTGQPGRTSPYAPAAYPSGATPAPQPNGAQSNSVPVSTPAP